MTKGKLFIGLAAVTLVLVGSAYFTSSDDLQGRFNFSGGRGANELDTKPFPGSNLGGGDEDETAVLMTVNEDVPSNIDVDGFTLLGSWYVSYADEAEPCYEFKFKSTGNDSMKFGDDLTDARMYVVTGDTDLESAIASNNYTSYSSLSSLYFQPTLSSLTSGEARLVLVYGELVEGADATNAKVYMRDVCVYDADYTEYSWTNLSDDAHFSMESDSNGIYGSVTLNY
ncbi:MAG: hypothetical protein ACI9QC_000061 [Oceanicoccus sp.]|jgi:hypothetical protein